MRDQDADTDFPPDDMGESITRRGEDVLDQEGKEGGRYDGTKGPAQRPVGKGSSTGPAR